MLMSAEIPPAAWEHAHAAAMIPFQLPRLLRDPADAGEHDGRQRPAQGPAERRRQAGVPPATGLRLHPDPGPRVWRESRPGLHADPHRARSRDRARSPLPPALRLAVRGRRGGRRAPAAARRGASPPAGHAARAGRARADPAARPLRDARRDLPQGDRRHGSGGALGPQARPDRSRVDRVADALRRAADAAAHAAAPARAAAGPGRTGRRAGAPPQLRGQDRARLHLCRLGPPPEGRVRRHRLPAGGDVRQTTDRRRPEPPAQPDGHRGPDGGERAARVPGRPAALPGPDHRHARAQLAPPGRSGRLAPAQARRSSAALLDGRATQHGRVQRAYPDADQGALHRDSSGRRVAIPQGGARRAGARG